MLKLHKNDQQLVTSMLTVINIIIFNIDINDLWIFNNGMLRHGQWPIHNTSIPSMQVSIIIYYSL